MKDQVTIFLIPVLKILSDPEYQAKIWLKKVGPEVCSYTATTEAFFDIGDAISYNKEMQELLGPKACEMLEKLSEEIENYDSTLKDNDIENVQLTLSNPKWQTIQRHARDLYEVLK